MTERIETAAERDALPQGSVILSLPDEDGYRYSYELLDEGWFMPCVTVAVNPGIPIYVLYRPDAEPDFGATLGAPTTPEPQQVQPSAEDVAEAICRVNDGEAYVEDGGPCSACEGAADAVLALLPGRTEAEVVEEYRRLDGYTPALRDVALERMTHAERGWTAEHDAEHGVDHLAVLAGARANELVSRWRYGVQDAAWARAQLVKAASLLVAAIDLLDREEAQR